MVKLSKRAREMRLPCDRTDSLKRGFTKAESVADKMRDG